MQAAPATVPPLANHLDIRKFQLIRQIAELESEELVSMMEELLSDYFLSDDLRLTEEEEALIEERLAELREQPQNVLAWEVLKHEFALAQ